MYCATVIALIGSAFIYLSHFDIVLPWLHTLLGILFFYLLLPAPKRTWFLTGFFLSLLWFWWIGLSFIHYHMTWAIPFVLLFIAFVYGALFWIIATLAEKIEAYLPSTLYPLPSLILKSFGLLGMSYIHPLSFDWFKPELMFVQSYLGIEKWQFAVLLAIVVLSLYRRTVIFLPLLLLAWQPAPKNITHTANRKIALITTHTPVEAKWDRTQQPAQFHKLLQKIDHAIDTNASTVVLPETAFPVYLERTPWLYLALQKRAKKINIITGALYWEEGIPRNSTYIFHKNGAITRANKVLLVPFGEKNPLPDFLSNWVNKVFYDGAVDYKADSNITDYMLDNMHCRNAICFEATSEKLYEGYPKHMIVLSNNGWFVPSIEPTLQRLLLQYYSKKYDTIIYHAVNMAPSYTIVQGEVHTL